MRVELISVGTELLLGDIVNTNAQYLSRELANMGISIYNQSTVGDNMDRLVELLKDATKRSDIVITTGGLGPTNDDITKEAAARCFDQEMFLDTEVWEVIYERMKNFRKGAVITENNKKQAYFPKEGKLIPNNHGTAPGYIFEKDGKKIIVMPGPPREMKAMFNETVKKYMAQFSDDLFISKYIRFYGIGESRLESELTDLLNEQSNPTVACYAKTGEVMVRVTASGKCEEECIKLIDAEIEKIKAIAGEYIYLIGGDEVSDSQSELNNVTAELLVDNGLTLSVSESCTGGKVAASLIDYPGISQALLEGCVTYSNEAKMKRLGVKKETLDSFGAVSYQTACEMAEGVRTSLGADIGASTTGIAGPGGGTDEKPVGLVYMAVSYKGEVEYEEHIYPGDRATVRRRATNDCIDLIRRTVLKNIEK